MAAYSYALASESVTGAMEKKWDPKTKTYVGLTHDEIVAYAKIIAYKVAHNLSLGFTMDPTNDPLTYIDCGEERREPWSLDLDGWKPDKWFQCPNCGNQALKEYKCYLCENGACCCMCED